INRFFETIKPIMTHFAVDLKHNINLPKLWDKKSNNDKIFSLFKRLYDKYFGLILMHFTYSFKKLKPEDINVFSVKFYLKKEKLIQTLNSLILGKDVLILIKKVKNLDPILTNFFQFLFQDSFNVNVIIKNFRDYKKQENSNENLTVIGRRSLKKRKNSDDIKFLRGIVDKFYNIYNPNRSIMYLRKKLQNIYKLSKKIYEYSEEKHKNYYLKKEIKSCLEKDSFEKIKGSIFKSLLLIVEKYFDKKITLPKDVFANMINELYR
ncbi:MAG: hypothetical protein ACFFAO_08080, partial [Candidatus Hermodarchaeota archaeon]